ncbi:MAG: hypothetical protein AAGL17_22335 [Cyanobacteria bacterium J06576_12]
MPHRKLTSPNDSARVRHSQKTSLILLNVFLLLLFIAALLKFIGTGQVPFPPAASTGGFCFEIYTPSEVAPPRLSDDPFSDQDKWLFDYFEMESDSEFGKDSWLEQFAEEHEEIRKQLESEGRLSDDWENIRSTNSQNDTTRKLQRSWAFRLFLILICIIIANLSAYFLYQIWSKQRETQ